MAEAYIGQIELFAFDFAPRGWYPCHGQLLSIQQNQALFSILGTTFGGNGVTNFQLPDLRGRLVVGTGRSYSMGQTGGEEQHVLAVAEVPPQTHSHQIQVAAKQATTAKAPSGTSVLGQSKGAIAGGGAFDAKIYAAPSSPPGALDPGAIQQQGGGGHENRMPYIALTYCMCYQGIYPSGN